MKKLKKNFLKFLDNIFVKNADHYVWIVSSAVLFLILVVFGLYTYLPDFSRSVNTLLWGSQQQNQTQEKLIKLPVTIVYNSSSEEQKEKMEQFLDNLADPTRALQDTELEPKWLDFQTPEAQQLIRLSGLKYLPQIFLDPSIEQHPQYTAMKQYVANKGSVFFIRLAPLEELGTPSPEGGIVDGADPTKAKVVIQAYESYACDHCGEARATLSRLVKKYPKTVSVLYKHFEPGNVYNQIAQGAECAADQNKFFEMQDKLFKDQPDMLKELEGMQSEEEALSSVKKLLLDNAKALRLDVKLFQKCIDDKIHEKDIELQTEDAINYGINNPPAFFINNTFQNGLLSYEDFAKIVESKISQGK